MTREQLNEHQTIVDGDIDIDIHTHIDEQDRREEVDLDRNTVLFLKAVAGEISKTEPDGDQALIDRAYHILRDTHLSAEQAARFMHRRRVVAPLLMLLALGLLFAAGVSSC